MARVNVRVDVDCISISSLYLTFPILSASDEVTAAEPACQGIFDPRWYVMHRADREVPANRLVLLIVA